MRVCDVCMLMMYVMDAFSSSSQSADQVPSLAHGPSIQRSISRAGKARTHTHILTDTSLDGSQHGVSVCSCQTFRAHPRHRLRPATPTNPTASCSGLPPAAVSRRLVRLQHTHTMNVLTHCSPVPVHSLSLSLPVRVCSQSGGGWPERVSLRLALSQRRETGHRPATQGTAGRPLAHTSLCGLSLDLSHSLFVSISLSPDSGVQVEDHPT